MKFAYFTLYLAKRLYDKAATQEAKDRIAHEFFKKDAELVIEEIKRAMEG